jgi:hypothetical protein
LVLRQNTLGDLPDPLVKPFTQETHAENGAESHMCGTDRHAELAGHDYRNSGLQGDTECA